MKNLSIKTSLIKILVTLVAVFNMIPMAFAGGFEEMQRLRSQWEIIKYRTPEKEQESAMQDLAKASAKLKAAYPQDASLAIWNGIIEASYAGLKGGLGALSWVKSAKQSFEDAIAVDPEALEGAAYTSLGTLYYQVPGWPIGFGDEKKAAEFLKKGLVINSNGIDANYFYGDFLFKTGDYQGADRALKKALQAPARQGRSLADEGRRREVVELLAKIEENQRNRGLLTR